MDLASLDLGSPLGTRVDSASVAVPRVARCASVLSGATSLAGSEAGSSPPSLSASHLELPRLACERAGGTAGAAGAAGAGAGVAAGAGAAVGARATPLRQVEGSAASASAACVAACAAAAAAGGVGAAAAAEVDPLSPQLFRVLKHSWRGEYERLLCVDAASVRTPASAAPRSRDLGVVGTAHPPRKNATAAPPPPAGSARPRPPCRPSLYEHPTPPFASYHRYARCTP